MLLDRRHLTLEAIRVLIVDLDPSIVSHALIRFLQTAISLASLLSVLKARSIVCLRVELLSAIGCRDKMENGIVSVLSQIDGAHVHIVHDGLPRFRGHVCLTITETPVNQQHDFLIGDKTAGACNLKEGIFKCNLHTQ